MSALVAIVIGLVVLVTLVKLALGLLGIVVALALAVAAYFIAEKVIGQGR